MTFEMLHCFSAVCQEQSITRAAERLYISKQAVSSSIKSIETELGVSLLVRQHSGVRLTPAGHRLLRHAGTILRQWEMCLSDLSALRGDLPGLRIGMAYMARTLWTPEAEQAFYSRSPETAVDIRGGYASDLLTALAAGKLDCVVTFLRTEYRARFDFIPLCDAPLSFLMAEDDPLAAHPLLLPQDLQGRTVLFHESGASYLNELADWLASSGISITPRLVSHTTLAIEQAAIRDERAISLRNAIYHSAEPQTIGYVTRLADMDAFRGAPPLTICILLPKGSTPSLDLLTFAAFLRARLQSLSQTLPLTGGTA